MGVTERRNRQPAAQVQHPGEPADVVADLVVAAQVHDRAPADRGRLHETGRMGRRADLPVHEDKFRAFAANSHAPGC